MRTPTTTTAAATRKKTSSVSLQEFALPSGAELIMSDPCLLPKAFRIKAVEDQRRWN